MSDYHNKKSTGSFYTPAYIVDFMVDRVFNLLNSEARIDSTSFKSYTKSLAKISFCDISVGTGNFIIGILRKVWNDLKVYSTSDLGVKKVFFKKFFEQNIFGVEINLDVLNECKDRIPFTFPQLKKCNHDNLKHGNSIVEHDAYQVLTEQEANLLNSFNWDKEFGSMKSFDIIIGNPPYYNLKKMELIDEHTKIFLEYLKNSENWSEFYRSSSDIYYYFMFKALNILSEGGLLSFIVPDYWIENKYADKLREYILNYQILELIDLSNHRIFKDNGKWLNVSNCITFIKKSSPSKSINVCKNLSKRLLDNYTNNRDKLSQCCYEINQFNLTKEKWVLSAHLDLLRSIEKNTQGLENYAKVIQGMSPGAKDIFVVSATKAQELKLEREILVPFIINSDVKKWLLDYSNPKVSILPSRIEDIADFPKIQSYLKSNQTLLTKGSDRKRLMDSGKIRWFDYSVYRNLESFQQTDDKIFVPYRSLIPRFGLDDNNSFGATDVYAIIPKHKSDLLFLLGLLNSDVIHFWYLEAGKRKGKMLEFFSDPLRRIPIPTAVEKKMLTGQVEGLLKLLKNSNTNLKEIQQIEFSINREVANLYDVDYNLIKKLLDNNSIK